MSFFEDIAAALDVDGIESRVHDDTMFVPITPELEIQFVEIDPILPAANVYIAAADVDEDDDDFEAVLVSVVFSVDDALDAVARHVATDQVVTVLRDLLEGTDERISDLEFFQDLNDANLVRAEVGQNSELHVVVESAGGTPTATVMFVALGESYDELVNQAMAEMWTLTSSPRKKNACVCCLSFLPIFLWSLMRCLTWGLSPISTGFSTSCRSPLTRPKTGRSNCCPLMRK